MSKLGTLIIAVEEGLTRCDIEELADAIEEAYPAMNVLVLSGVVSAQFVPGVTRTMVEVRTDDE